MRSLAPESEAEQLHWLAFFALNQEAVREEAQEAMASIPEDVLKSLLQLADLHHVACRIFGPIAEAHPILANSGSTLKDRNTQIVARVAEICHALQTRACPAMVIKSTDHWPDIGNDIDLFTTGEAETVHRVMKKEFDAEPQAQNWGDRLANKWNFRVPGLTPLIEIHVDRLGQTGELKSYGEELIDRRRQRQFGGIALWVPAREDQIVLSALQRLYRHFFYRICDFADALAVLDEGLDFERLRLIAKRHCIWQGVATHLRLVSEYIEHYTGTAPVLPLFVRKSARFGIERLYPHAGYLRIPLFPQGATLWGRQVIKNQRCGRRYRPGSPREDGQLGWIQGYRQADAGGVERWRQPSPGFPDVWPQPVEVEPGL